MNKVHLFAHIPHPRKKTNVLLTLGLILTAATSLCACAGDEVAAPARGAVTFWHDVAPIYNEKCVRCHQEGGIAPFRLDDYATAKSHADVELARVTDGSMPPYHMVHDGSCGSFHDEATLSDQQKATIKSWVEGGQNEGTVTTLSLPPPPRLDGALDITTPTFAPVAQGGALALYDEYRCFLLDAPNQANAFLTGYDVTPGEPSIVHHLLTFIVDPAAASHTPGKSNGALMTELDGQSPDRLGWPCFAGAGDNVAVNGVPVTWAPGQGVVEYPDGMGVAIRTTDKLVVQIHYNLADAGSAGKIDSTAVHLRFADRVTRPLTFLLPDPLLESLGSPRPDTLPPGQPDASYSWTRNGQQIGVTVPSVDLVAVMPHMHNRGLRQVMKMGPPGALACASHLEPWDFHWQEVYFYKTRPVITPTTQLQVTCAYDTSADKNPVQPGWGTRNEMCLTVLMVAPSVAP